ncbi:MAG: aromatic amino acid transport family protein [Candidatus Nanoarchaeia archaeon]|nr:aromatic amino acid transport family protein [Candidatus Nanoarchaeia archaeon]MDD5239557.1 aromatic amino acid transport family protein [Candidatus Nanoarchaeia archaeon]
MVKKSNLNFFIATALIIGTIFGAGVFGIPYAVSKAGFPLGLILIVVLGIAVTLMTLYMAEVVLRTNKTKQFVGLAEKYLGKPGKSLMFLSTVIGMIGVLTAYLVGIGNTAHTLFGFGSPLIFTFAFFAIASFLIYFGLKSIGKAMLVLTSVLIAVILIVCFIMFPNINAQNVGYIDTNNFFFPFGIILLALLGYSIIPEVEIVLKNEKKKMLGAIILASAACITIYVLFTLAVLGAYGSSVAEIATMSFTGLPKILGNLVALAAMSAAFLSLGTVMTDVFVYDLKLKRWLAWLIACFVPLGLLVVFSPSFITMLDIVGIYSGGLTGVLAALMVLKARKKGDVKPAFVVPGGKPLIYAVLLLFLFGMVYQTLVFAGVI